MVGGGFLYRLSQLNFLPMYLCLVAGDFAADLVWYFVGYYGGRPLIVRYGKFFNITEEIIQKIEKRFRTYQTSILIVSKLTMGFGFSLATLITAGILKVSFRKYVAINLVGGFIWVGFLVLVGYLFGHVYLVIPDSIKVIFVLIGAIAVFFALRTINRYLVNTEI